MVARRHRHCRGRGAVIVAGLGVLVGCTGPGADQAAQVAQSFEQLATSDSTQACELLSGHTREAVEKAAKTGCSDALNDEDLPEGSAIRHIDVYGHDARVTLDKDVIFLARFPEGWKVTAAGCKPGSSEDEPFDCAVSGG